MKIRNAQDDDRSNWGRLRHQPSPLQIDHVVTDVRLIPDDRPVPIRRIVIDLEIDPRTGAIVNFNLRSSSP